MADRGRRSRNRAWDSALGVVMQLTDALNIMWEVEESKESGLRAQLRIVVCCGAGPWLSSPRLSPGNGGTGCRRKVRRAPYMPEGVLYLVACWASFVVVALFIRNDVPIIRDDVPMAARRLCCLSRRPLAAMLAAAFL